MICALAMPIFAQSDVAINATNPTTGINADYDQMVQDICTTIGNMDSEQLSSLYSDLQLQSIEMPSLEMQQALLSNSPNRIACAVCAILLPGFGVHNFLLGKVGLGIVDILFCWTGIPELVGLVKGIVWLCMTDEEFAAKYGN